MSFVIVLKIIKQKYSNERFPVVAPISTLFKFYNKFIVACEGTLITFQQIEGLLSDCQLSVVNNFNFLCMIASLTTIGAVLSQKMSFGIWNWGLCQFVEIETALCLLQPTNRQTVIRENNKNNCTRENL